MVSLEALQQAVANLKSAVHRGEGVDMETFTTCLAELEALQSVAVPADMPPVEEPVSVEEDEGGTEEETEKEPAPEPPPAG